MKLTKVEERLRRESPAYQPDGDWEKLDPQAMQVVMSVRFDPRTARRLVAAARAAGESPSGLVRAWIQERLALSGAEGRDTRTAIGEAASAYSAADATYEDLRRRYRPEHIDTLLVGESRPAGGTFFYLANSNLYYATHEAFQMASGPMPSGEAFLRLLQKRGVWLYDLADVPVDRMAGRPRRSTVQARIGELVNVLRESTPRLVVAIKRSLAPTVRLAMMEAGLSTDRLRVLPFPLYQWRRQYVESLAAIVAGAQQPRRQGESGRTTQSPHRDETGGPTPRDA